MSFFYDLNKRLANLGEQQKQISESVEQAAAKKSPVQKILEQALRTDLKSLMEDGTGGMNFSGSGSLEEGNVKYGVCVVGHNGGKPVKTFDNEADAEAYANKGIRIDGKLLQGSVRTLVGEADYSAKKAAAGKDIGKPGKNFAKIAKKSGGGEKGNKIAGAVLAKLRAAKESVEEASETMEAGAGGIHGRMPDPMTKKDQQKKMNPPRSLEEKDESEEDIMDYLNRKLAPYEKQQQAKEGVVGATLGGIAGAAVGGPVGAVRGAMAGNAIGNAISPDEETDEDACAVPYNKGTGRPDAHNGMEFEGEDMNIEETVSRKHFQQVADLLKNIPDEAKRKEMALHHASIFAKQNPRFDIRRFGQAAGVDLEECALWEELKGGQVKLDKNHNGSLDANDFAMLRKGAEETDEGWADAMAAGKAAANQKPAFSRHDVKDTGYSKVYTRKPETFDDPETDPEATGGAPKRGRGRPASNKPVEKRVTKGAWKHKVAEEGEEEVDEEKQEAGKRHFFDKLAPAAKKVAKVVGAVTKGKKEVDEESTDKKDTKAEKAGKKVAKNIEHDEDHKGKDDNKAEKAGKKVTKDIEYDDKKDKEEKVDETTTSGSVATASTSSKGAGQVGKGIYDSWNRQYQKLLAESVNVSQESTKMEDGNEEEAITIQVSGDDVARFKEVLASMGLGQQGGATMAEPAHDDSCGTCGGTPCQCDELGAEVVGLPGELEIGEDDMEEGNEFSGELVKAKAQHKDEFEVDGKTYPVKEADAPVSQNSPDYPTNQEYDDDALQYAGGLNKPKRDIAGNGQTTIPVTAVRNQVAESSEDVDSFLNLYQSFKTK
jgi:hypothetical protein